MTDISTNQNKEQITEKVTKITKDFEHTVTHFRLMVLLCIIGLITMGYFMVLVQTGQLNATRTLETSIITCSLWFTVVLFCLFRLLRYKKQIEILNSIKQTIDAIQETQENTD